MSDVAHCHDHAHDHDHAHGHSHNHARGQTVGRLSLVLILTGLYMVVEFVAGFWSNSLALIADAGHMLTDVGAIGLALAAAYFAAHPPSAKKTFGYYRLEIMAAFVNGLLLVLMSLYIFYEATQRLGAPSEIKGTLMTAVSVGGLLINLASAALLSHHHDNLNTRAAYAHVIADCLGSVGAIAAGIGVIVFHWVWADPAISILIALLVLYSAGKLIMETANVLLEGVPVHLSTEDIRRALTEIPAVSAVHDLHVWSITLGREAMSVHVVVREPGQFTPDLLRTIQSLLKDRFGLTHVTVQLETEDFETEDHEHC